MNAAGMALPTALNVCSAKLHVKVTAAQPCQPVWLAVRALRMYACIYWQYMLNLAPGRT